MKTAKIVLTAVVCVLLALVLIVLFRLFRAALSTGAEFAAGLGDLAYVESDPDVTPEPAPTAPPETYEPPKNVELVPGETYAVEFFPDRDEDLSEVPIDPAEN